MYPTPPMASWHSWKANVADLQMTALEVDVKARNTMFAILGDRARTENTPGVSCGNPLSILIEALVHIAVEFRWWS
jgi:hypothetical protein